MGGRVARADDHSPASSAEVKNERSSAPVHAFMAWRGIIFLFCSFMLEIGNVGDGFLEFTQKQSH
jgi:hypothetical protein